MFPKFRKQFYLIALVVFVAALALPSFAYAGGWAVVTLDRLPENVIAGQPYAIGFMIRQHGRSPWQVGEIQIEARQSETGKTIAFVAKPDHQPGHYQAELLFPESGNWQWGIQSGLYPEMQPMPTLKVVNGTVAAASGSENPTTVFAFGSSIPWLGVVALLSFVGGMMIMIRGRTRQVYKLAGIGLLVLCGGLAFAFFSSANAEAQQIQPGTANAVDENTGQQLFLAKGCVVCHTNIRAIDRSADIGVSVGPELSTYQNDPVYLAKFLANPQELKPTSEMPNLNLSSDEIDDLVKFINDHEAK